MNRGPRYLWGDLKASEMTLKRAKLSAEEMDSYAAAFNIFIQSPDASFADISNSSKLRSKWMESGGHHLGVAMLGAGSPQGAQVWVRSLKPASVTVRVGSGKTSREYGPVESTVESDLSTAITVSGLESNTEYPYQVFVDGEPAKKSDGAILRTAPKREAKGQWRIAFGGEMHKDLQNG